MGQNSDSLARNSRKDLQSPHRILISGLPRSGTTWVAKALARAPGTAYSHEPDNDRLRPFAFKAKADLGRYPLMRPGDSADGYERLWRAAFALDISSSSRLAHTVTRPPRAISYRLFKLARDDVLAHVILPRHLRGGLAPKLRVVRLLAQPAPIPRGASVNLVKSVQSTLALDWIAERVRPKVVVVQAHPLNTISGWLKMTLPMDLRLYDDPLIRSHLLERWQVGTPPKSASHLERTAWQLGILVCAQQEAIKAHPEFVSVSHEDLCRDVEGGFRSLFATLDLPWTRETEEFLDESNRPGTRYETNRVSEGLAERWRTRLSDEEVRSIELVLKPFPIEGWPHN